MCWSCGSLEPSNPHADGRTITTSVLQDAADHAGTDIPGVIQNLMRTLAVVQFAPTEKATDSYTPNAGMKDAAKRALEWHEEGKKGGTGIGLGRARDIAAGRTLSQEVVNRMHSFFARHEVDKQAEGFNAGEDGFPSPGRVAWDLWGGDAGQSWSAQRVASKETLDAITDHAALNVVKSNDERRYTLGVAYPAMKVDVGVAADGHRDFVSHEALEKAAWQWMTKHRDIGLYHRDGTGGRGTVVESYIWRGEPWVIKAADGTEQKVMTGDWLLGVQWREDTWPLIKAGLIKGYSPQGGARRIKPNTERIAQLRK
jgi:Putative phage serine protease XkdF